MKKILLLIILIGSMLMPACEDLDNSTLTDEEELLMLSVTKGSVAGKPYITSKYPTDNATGIPIANYITIVFNEDMNSSTINSNTIKVYRNSNNEVVPGRVVYSGGVATFKPIFKFTFTSSDKAQSGLKQDETYKVVLDTANIKDVQGETLNAATQWTFKTADLDYGIYFFNSDGEFEKSVAGRTNSFFDKTKNTVLYVHGWQNGSTASDFGRECAFFSNNSKWPNLNTIGTWKNKGWNVAVLYWSQFADEGEVKDAQAKIYMANNNGRKNMRYKIRNGSYLTFLNNTKTVTQIAYEEYSMAFSGYTGAEVRFAGHSLGNQLATTLAMTVSDKVAAGQLSSSLMPKRLALLDPFWGKFGETCVGGKWVGEVCRAYVKTMLTRNKIALEQFKSSAMGGAVADENLDMRKMASFYRIWPDFIGVTDQTSQHLYAYIWYGLSMGGTVSGGTGVSLGAAATADNIKATSNWNYSTNSVKSSQYFWYTSSGKSTYVSSDDAFTKKSGVSTW